MVLSCSDYYNREKASLIIPENETCLLVRDTFLDGILNELFIQGTLKVDDNFSFTIRFKTIHFASQGKLVIGSRLFPIVKNLIIFKQEGQNDCEESPFGSLDISSIPYSSKHVNFLKEEEVVRFMKESFEFSHGDQLFLLQSNNINLSFTEHTVERQKGRSIYLSPQIPNSIRIFDEEQFEFSSIVVPQPRKSYGILFDGVCLYGQLDSLIGVTFRNTQKLVLSGIQIKNCYFTNDSESTVQSSSLQLYSSITDCIFFNIEKIQIRTTWWAAQFASNIIIRSHLHLMLYTSLQETTLIDSSLKFQISSDHRQRIYVSQSKLFNSSLNFHEDGLYHLNMDNSLIWNTKHFIQSHKLQNLTLNNMMVIQSCLFENLSLAQLTISKSFFQGSKQYDSAFQFGKLSVSEKVQIELEDSVFAGYNKQIFTMKGYDRYSFELDISDRYQFRVQASNISLQQQQNNLFRMFKLPRLLLIIDNNKIILPIVKDTLLSPALSVEQLQSQRDQIIDDDLNVYDIFTFDEQPLFLQFKRFYFQNLPTSSFESYIITDNFRKVNQSRIVYTITADQTVRFQLQGVYRNSFENVEFNDLIIQKIDLNFYDCKFESVLNRRRAIEFVNEVRAIKSISIQNLADSSLHHESVEPVIISQQFTDRTNIIWTFVEGILTVNWWSLGHREVGYRISFNYCEENKKSEDGECVDVCSGQRKQFNNYCLLTHGENKQIDAYAPSSIGVYQRCPPNCQACNLLYQCERCLEYFFVQEHQCVSRCSIGYFLEENRWQCSLIKKIFLECENENNCPKNTSIEIENKNDIGKTPQCIKKLNGYLFGCLECYQTFELIDGMCIKSTEQSDQNKLNIIPLESKSCKSPCIECSVNEQGEQVTCITCEENYGLLKVKNMNQCVQCPIDSFSLGTQCEQCQSECGLDYNCHIVQSQTCDN